MSTDNPIPNERYWLCPLYSFDCYFEGIDLTEGIQIKPAPNELQQYLRERTYYLYGRWSDPSDVNWAVFFPYCADASGVSDTLELMRIGLEEDDRVRDLLVDLVTSLKLCHKGRVTAGPLMFASTHNSEWSMGSHTIWTLVSKRDFLSDEPIFVFHQSDVPKVNELVSNLSRLRELGKLDSLGVALRRFHSSYYGDIEDRIIDQMIAFESLYLEDTQELTYKLALRAALLLTKRRNKRESIFSDMKKAYKYRSKIVHGDTRVSREKLREIIPKTEDYLRQSIQRFLSLLSQGKTLGEIREKLLDENILKNGNPLAIRE